MDTSSNRRLSRWLWVIPAAAGFATLGWETDWGRELLPPHAPKHVAAAASPSVALLPEFRIDGGLQTRKETVARTLFNPTRRPAPVAVAEAPKAKMQPGQFALTGTSLDGQASIAFLREVASGRSWIVKRGDRVKEMQVAEVRPDRVRLTLGDDAEELVLKTARPALAPPAVPPRPFNVNAPGAQPPATQPFPQPQPSPTVQPAAPMFPQPQPATPMFPQAQPTTAPTVPQPGMPAGVSPLVNPAGVQTDAPRPPPKPEGEGED